MNQHNREDDFEEISEWSESLEEKPLRKWEASNTALLSQLARFDHYRRQGMEPPPESLETLYRAFKEAQLMVPLEYEMQTVVDEDGRDKSQFELMMRPDENFGGQLIGVAFTCRDEAQAFFNNSLDFHRLVTSGEALADMLLTVIRTLNERGDENRNFAALLIDPVGPHPFAFGVRDLVMLAHGGTPLDRSHANIESQEFNFRRYSEGDPTAPSPGVLEKLRECIAQIAPSLGVREVLFFELTIGNTPPHLGLAIPSRDSVVLDKLGDAILEVWQRNVPQHRIFDLLSLDAALEKRIRPNAAILWEEAPKAKLGLLESAKRWSSRFKPR